MRTAKYIASIAIVALAAWLIIGHKVQHAGATGPVTLTIDAMNPICDVGARFDGVNVTALWNDTEDSPGATRMLAGMGQKLVRFPGGVPAEWYDWQHPLASGWTDMTPESAWKMARAGGARLIFQTNAATSKMDINKKTGAPYSFDNSGAHAAAWAAACKAAGIKVAYWEIGNEPELDAPQSAKGTQDGIYAWYNAKFTEQAKAIKAVDPSAKIMGPSSANTWYWWHEGNLEKFLKAHGNKQGDGLVDAISVHWYPGDDSGAWEKNRDNAEGWADNMAFIRKTIQEYDTRTLPIIVSEWNFGGGDKNTSSTTLGDALGNADCIGQFRNAGVTAEQFFTLQHVDHNWGVLGTKKDTKRQDEPSPTYFALALASHLGRHVLPVDGNADAPGFEVYAASDDRGHVQAMLINKTAAPISASLQIKAPDIVGKEATTWILAGVTGSPQDTDVVYNGKTSATWSIGPLPPPQTAPYSASQLETIPPHSIMVIDVGG